MVIVTERTIRRAPPVALSQLVIDVDKDWEKRNIVNFGPGGVDLYSTLTSHAPRHEYGGADPVRNLDYLAIRGTKVIDENLQIVAGKIRRDTSQEIFRCQNDTPQYFYFALRDAGDTAPSNHYFAPLTDTYGSWGSPSNRWYWVYAYSAHIWRLSTRGSGTSYIPSDSGTDHTLIPASDGYSYIGTASYRFRYIRGVTVVAGDIGVEDRRCLVCGREFREGDAVVFKVRRVDGENAQVLLVPVHAECNPHPLDPELLKEHEKMLLPNRGRGEYFEPNPPSPGEFEVVSVTVEDEDTMIVNCICGDGTALSFPAPVDADEETIVRLAREYYKLEKEREREVEDRRAKGRARLRRDWRGFKGRLR